MGNRRRVYSLQIKYWDSADNQSFCARSKSGAATCLGLSYDATTDKPGFLAAVSVLLDFVRCQNTTPELLDRDEIGVGSRLITNAVIGYNE